MDKSIEFLEIYEFNDIIIWQSMSYYLLGIGAKEITWWLYLGWIKFSTRVLFQMRYQQLFLYAKKLVKI